MGTHQNSKNEQGESIGCSGSKRKKTHMSESNDASDEEDDPV